MAENGFSTSEYWRKLLKLDKAQGKSVLQNFNYPHRFLRPLFFIVFGILARLYFRVRCSGRENLPDPPYILAPNHTSSLDYPLVAYCVGAAKRKDIYVLATKFFYDIPFSRFFMKMASNVQRIDIDEDFIPGVRAAAAILNAGKAIYIHPEGTRSKTGELLPFRPGVGMLSCELNVPVVPVYISGANKSLPSGSVFPKPGNIGVRFGKPLMPDHYVRRLSKESAYFVYRDLTDELMRRVSVLKDSAVE